MINKSSLLALSTIVLLFTSSSYDGGSMAPVVFSGAIIKSDGVEIKQKYNRKDCPVCKGTGKYLSGDQIKMVDCGYCEPETKLTHPAIKIYGENNKNCLNSDCKCKTCKCKNCGCVPSIGNSP